MTTLSVELRAFVSWLHTHGMGIYKQSERYGRYRKEPESIDDIDRLLGCYLVDYPLENGFDAEVPTEPLKPIESRRLLSLFCAQAENLTTAELEERDSLAARAAANPPKRARST